MRFTSEELQTYRDARVPDLIGPGLRLLFVGINPGLWTAATQTHFAHPSNRFYPALLAAGLIEIAVDPAAGMGEAERAHLVERGIGITNLVNRATARADELPATELKEGARRLVETVTRYRPAVVAVAGVTAYRTAFGRPRALLGPQPQPIGGAEVWVVANPSGLNAHETVASLARQYRRVGEAAGIVDG